MKLHGDPWNNRWSSFYGIAWNVSMEFHRKCHNPPWKTSMQKFPWNSMEIGALIFSIEFHGKCPNPPCKYFPWKSMDKFPWNSMEIDVLILHGIPWRIFHGNFQKKIVRCVAIETTCSSLTSSGNFDKSGRRKT